MSRRFMIVKPRPCCGYSLEVGNVCDYHGKYVGPVRCIYCGEKDMTQKTYLEFDGVYIVHESRIVWLPPESDIIEHDTIQEIEDKLKV
jgi:hypothetical protein